MVFENEVGLKAKAKELLGVVTKRVELINIQVGANYENAVNNHLVKEGESPEFVAQSLPWGHWVDGQVNKIIEHNGVLYMRFYGLRNTSEKRTYKVNGVDATPEQEEIIKANLLASETKPRFSFKQAECGLVNEDEQVSPSTIRFENILTLKLDKQVAVA
jgi:hypothetical protein